MSTIYNALKIKSSDEAKVTSLKNQDIVPMGMSRRTWQITGFLFFWIIDKTLVGSWYGSSAILSLGFSVGETMAILLISFVIIVTLSMFSGQIGSDYFIGFTVSMRAVFGIKGSKFPVLLRVLLSIVWYASQSWTTALCFICLLSALSKNFLYMENTFPDSVNFTSQQLIGFVLSQVVAVPLLFVKPEKLKPFMISSSLCSFLAMIGLLIATVKTSPGLGPLMHTKGSLTGSTFSWTFVYGISSNFSGICSGVCNFSDYCRFASPKNSKILGINVDSRYAPYPGTVICWFSFGVAVPLMGLISASAMQAKYDTIYWKPTDFMLVWLEENYSSANRAGIFFASAAFIYCNTTFNILGNSISAGCDASGLWPEMINIRRGSMICVVLCWVVQPWNFYNSSSGATFVAVMSSFSVFMTPVIGILLCDYFLIRHRKLKLSDLYTYDPNGVYWYWRGYNLRAFVAFFAAGTPGLVGLIHVANENIEISLGAQRFYQGLVFFSFSISFSTYYILHRIFPIQGIRETDPVDYFNVYSDEQAKKAGLITYEDWIASGGNPETFECPTNDSEQVSEVLLEVGEKGNSL